MLPRWEIISSTGTLVPQTKNKKPRSKDTSYYLIVNFIKTKSDQYFTIEHFYKKESWRFV